MEIPRPHSKPPLGKGIPLEAGAWTEIISLLAPAKAISGSQVNVEVKVKNLATYGIYIAVTGVFDSTQITFIPDYANVNAGATYTFSGSFTMPSKGVAVHAYSYYWTGSVWYLDDEMTKQVTLETKVWIVLATTSLSVKKALVGAWVPLVTTTLTVKKALVGAWVPLATTTLVVKKGIIGGWVPLVTTTLAVKKGIVGGWVPLITTSLAIKAGAVAGKDVFRGDLVVVFSKHKG